jgi:hypothetical protein
MSFGHYSSLGLRSYRGKVILYGFSVLLPLEDINMGFFIG